MLTAWVSMAVVAAGACALVLLGRRLAGGGMSVVARNVRYQRVALGVAVLAVLAVRLLVSEHADYLAVGDWVLGGVLGWFLALSVLLTGGLGVALTIHATLDVVILTIFLAADPTRAPAASPQLVRT